MVLDVLRKQASYLHALGFLCFGNNTVKVCGMIQLLPGNVSLWLHIALIMFFLF